MSRAERRAPARRRADVADAAGVVIPRASYRLQLNAAFTFRDASALVPYLAALGISHVYCSPYFRARAGSTHGYDVVDHNSFNPEIGDRADFEQFVAALRAHGMGHIVDIVPNHVGIGADNVWWMDVLENGEASIYAAFFDIDWAPSNPDRGTLRHGARARRARAALRTAGGLVRRLLPAASAAARSAHLSAHSRPRGGAARQHRAREHPPLAGGAA
jgi:glycosidase